MDDKPIELSPVVSAEERQRLSLAQSIQEEIDLMEAVSKATDHEEQRRICKHISRSLDRILARWQGKAIFEVNHVTKTIDRILLD